MRENKREREREREREETERENERETKRLVGALKNKSKQTKKYIYDVQRCFIYIFIYLFISSRRGGGPTYLGGDAERGHATSSPNGFREGHIPARDMQRRVVEG